MPVANANGIQIEYETFGAGDRPAIVLIMGFGTQMLGWDEAFCQSLAARGYFVIRFDNRDIGLSTKFDRAPFPNVGAAMAGDFSSKPYDLEDMADDVVGLLDALAIPAAHLVGVSMGGMIAQHAAIKHPTRVLSLASIMSTTGDRTVGAPTSEAIAAIFTPPRPDRESQMNGAAALFRVIGSPGFPFDEARVRDRAGRSFDRCFHPLGVMRQLVALLGQRDRTAELATLRLPVVVVHGDSDPLVDHSGGAATARAIPNARLVTVPGMGHDLPQAAWSLFIDTIVSNAQLAESQRR